MPGHQPGEGVAAGHHHEARRAAGQQRTDLLAARCVVEQHQHPLPVQHAAVPRGAFVHVGWDVLAGHAERAQEPGQCVGRGHRLAGVVAAQIDIQLPAGKFSTGPVSPVRCQRGLANPGAPGDRGDHHRGRFRAFLGIARLAPGRQQPVELGHLVRAAGEGVHVRRQLSRDWPGAGAPGTGPGAARLPGLLAALAGRGAVPGWPVKRDVGGEDLLVQALQRRDRARCRAPRPARGARR